MRPARIRRMVDFPEPEGPRSATTSLRATPTEMSSRTRSGFPLGMVKSWDTWRASHNSSFVISFAQREAFFGEPVAPAPYGTIEGDHEHRHHEDGRGEARKVGARRGPADLCAETRGLERLQLERDVVGDDASVPSAPGGGDPAGDEVWKPSRKVERAKAIPARKSIAARDFFQIGRNRHRTGDDIEQNVPLRAQKHQQNDTP